jgi:porin
LLVESARVPGKGLGLYAKAAIADGNPNPVQRSFVGGVAGHAIVPGRPLDYFGVGYFYYDFSDKLQDAVAPVGSFRDEQGIEAYYAFVPTPWLRLTASLQWVNPANGANPSVWLGGLRVRVAF